MKLPSLTISKYAKVTTPTVNLVTMAVQSKLALPDNKSIKNAVAQLTKLYVKNRTRISRAVYLTLLVALVNRVRNAISEQKAASAREAAKRQSGTTSSDGTETTKKKKVELNREFFRSLLRLLKIVVPGARSKETRLLASHSFFLVVRTLISLKVAEMDGAIVKALVKGSGKEFLTRIVWWMLIAVPATFTNSMVSGWDNHLFIRRDHTNDSIAIVPPSRVVVEVPNTTNSVHPRQISVSAHILRNLCTRRPDKEPGSAHRSRCCQVL